MYYWMKEKHCLAAMALLLSISAWASDSYQPKIANPMQEEWRYAFFPELDNQGLRSIASVPGKDEVWFGLDSGVAKYDGYEWQYFSSQHGLSGDAVQKVFVDRDQKVYAATRRGLYIKEGDEWRTCFPLPPSPKVNFKSIEQLESGRLVAATDQGVFLYDESKTVLLSNPKRIVTFKRQEPSIHYLAIPDELLLNGKFDNFPDIHEVKPGELWIGITYKLEDEKGDIIILNEKDFYAEDIAQSGLLSNYYDIDLGYEQHIMQASNGDIWIINKSNKSPALRFRNDHWKAIYYARPFGDDEYSENILETDDGKIWISGIGNLYSLDPDGTWHKYNSENFKIPHGHIDIHSSDNSKLWIFEKKSSVTRVDLSHDKWLTYEGLNYQGKTAAGKTWFLDFEGRAIEQSANGWRQFDPQDGLIESPVSLYIDSKDYVWAVGSHQGVAAASIFIDDSWVKMKFDSMSWSVDYRAIFESSDGSIWLGGSPDVYLEKGQSGGLVQIINPHSQVRHPVYHKGRLNGLNQLNAYGITQSKDGRMWIGGTALCFFDKVSWKYLDIPDLNDFVNDVQNDDQGTLYVGSRQHGLYIYEDNDWTNYSINNGLVSNNIISVATSSDGDEIWVATDKDISYFNGKVWTNNIFPDELTLSFEGGTIKTNDQNEVWVSRSLREWKRRVYTDREPSQSAKDKFNCYRFIKDSIAPETFIQVYSETVENTGNTSIFWSGRHFFNKVNADQLSYSYRINDEPWSKFSSNTNHTFLGLQNGDYTFEVRAIDTEGNIDPTPARIEFSVLPPVWKQPWFISLIGSLLLVIGYFIYVLMKKQEVLEKLNRSLQSANCELESRNEEVQKQKDSLEEAVQKIEELSQAKVKFFTNITHEFRTPLSLILGPINKLEKDSTHDSKELSYYHIIKQNAKRLQKLINQLLEVRRIEAGNLDLVLAKNDVVAFIKGIKDLFNNQAVDRNINLQFATDFEKLEILYDQDKVEKVLFNLVSNAFKHTPNGGDIKISILQSETYLKKDSDLEFIRLVVEDSGTGLDKDILDKVFERFAVGHNDVEDQNEANSGIGLSYIKDLIEAHQGNIKVESETGKGTRFTVFIPQNLEAEGHIMAEDFEYQMLNGAPHPSESNEEDEDLNLKLANASAHDTEKQTILVVEDNRDMLAFIKSLLSDQFNVLSANNGEQGFDTLKSAYVDLVVSDIMMPKVDGITFCEKIKSDPTVSHIPVILLTAMAMNSKRIEGYESGADSYIVKPFEPELLNARVENLLDSREKLKVKYADNLKFKPKDIKVTSVDEEFIEKLSAMLEDHVSDAQFDVARMCEMVSMSHMHFIRKVKQLTGKKPVDLLKSFRLTRAKQLLSQGKINVSQVGYMVGYDLPNSFTRAFKKEYGISPTQFVHQIKDKAEF
ncbi:hybrid sensor histidine kinase/response regulator transcription factor [Reichenbachiella ulvae]|uniref:histidine kinase n=1 Tax=Reichenbachiella ulvae TaxID=2980104 RepID=A0ABT3CN84_9BACT|nr:hybrid sensor histidine kinase/response regulator transcription factor [Reichenbachiella ulvae]MCV9385092.1 response regulator [Reichenbachiella ulvae]